MREVRRNAGMRERRVRVRCGIVPERMLRRVRLRALCLASHGIVRSGGRGVRSLRYGSAVRHDGRQVHLRRDVVRRWVLFRRAVRNIGQ